MAGDRHAKVKAKQRRSVVWPIGVHGANHANIIDPLGQVGKDIADLNTALSILLKVEGRLHQIASASLCLRITAWSRFAVILIEHWLRIESIDMGRPASHKEVNDMLGFRWEVGSGSGERSLGRPCLCKKPGKTQRTKSIS